MGEGKKKKKRLEWERQPKHKRLLKTENRGAWVAQSVKRPTSARSQSLAVREFEPRVRLWADGWEPGACF